MVAHSASGQRWSSLNLRRGRTGFYLAVLEEGQVTPGDAIELIARNEHGVTVTDIVNLFYIQRTRPTKTSCKRLASCPRFPPIGENIFASAFGTWIVEFPERGLWVCKPQIAPVSLVTSVPTHMTDFFIDLGFSALLRYLWRSLACSRFHNCFTSGPAGSTGGYAQLVNEGRM